jgi:hypothetical protein
MAEWSKAAVLKTAGRQRPVGSNPTPSAKWLDSGGRQDANLTPPDGSCSLSRGIAGPGFITGRSLQTGFIRGEVAESAEGNRLLSGCMGKTVPRVRIPPSPPSFRIPAREGFERKAAADRTGRKRATLGSPAGGLCRREDGGDIAGVSSGESLPLRQVSVLLRYRSLDRPVFKGRGVRAGRRNTTGNRVGG